MWRRAFGKLDGLFRVNGFWLLDVSSDTFKLVVDSWIEGWKAWKLRLDIGKKLVYMENMSRFKIDI